MRRNIAGQKTGAGLVTTAGAAFTGTVTVYVTKDAGTQAIGSVGSGVCAHEGNGYHTYAPAQAETDGDLVAFTFIGTGASPVTVQHETSVHTMLTDIDYGLAALADHLSNIDGADANLSVGTLAAIADKLLGRSIQGGADGNRTVTSAFRRIRNRNYLSGAAGDESRTATVCTEDDNTIAYQSTVALDTGGGHPKDVNPTS